MPAAEDCHLSADLEEAEEATLNHACTVRPRYAARAGCPALHEGAEHGGLWEEDHLSHSEYYTPIHSEWAFQRELDNRRS